MFLHVYWLICVLQLFVSQVVTIQILKLPYLSSQPVSLNDQKSQDKNLYILRMKRPLR